jgi:hypothetical protein
MATFYCDMRFGGPLGGALTAKHQDDGREKRQRSIFSGAQSQRRSALANLDTTDLVTELLPLGNIVALVVVGDALQASCRQCGKVYRVVLAGG